MVVVELPIQHLLATSIWGKPLVGEIYLLENSLNIQPIAIPPFLLIHLLGSAERAWVFSVEREVSGYQTTLAAAYTPSGRKDLELKLSMSNRSFY